MYATEEINISDDSLNAAAAFPSENNVSVLFLSLYPGRVRVIPIRLFHLLPSVSATLIPQCSCHSVAGGRRQPSLWGTSSCPWEW